MGKKNVTPNPGCMWRMLMLQYFFPLAKSWMRNGLMIQTKWIKVSNLVIEKGNSIAVPVKAGFLKGNVKTGELTGLSISPILQRNWSTKIKTDKKDERIKPWRDIERNTENFKSCSTVCWTWYQAVLGSEAVFPLVLWDIPESLNHFPFIVR